MIPYLLPIYAEMVLYTAIGLIAGTVLVILFTRP